MVVMFVGEGEVEVFLVDSSEVEQWDCRESLNEKTMM